MTATGGRSGARPERVWAALELELPPSVADALLGAVGEACLGLESVPGRTAERFTAYFDARSGPAAERRLRALLRRHGLDPAACGLTRRLVADERWVERYQAGLRPFDVGGRFTVDPAGSGAASPGRSSIALVPGRAFGTGEHPTTRLCVEALERHVRAGSRWADVGCGSGILSVVAAGCGAREVLALDVDAEAAAVAREVVRRNEVGGIVRVAVGGDLAATDRRWDGIVCNISTAFLQEAGLALSRRLAAGGVFVASGWPATDLALVTTALTAGAALAELEVRTSDGWGAWAGRCLAERG